MTIEESMGDFGLFVTQARYLMRGASVASLASLEAGSGNPYASMITVTTETDGTPIFLISQLALHTRNLDADPRASVLFTAVGDADDPLALGRVSVMGIAERHESGLNRARFLARHPEAAGYASFADFSLWRLRVEKAHYVGGFGRIRPLAGELLIRDGDEIRAWNEGIDRVLINVNANSAAGLAKIAAQQGGKGDDWRLAACDPEGCELVGEGRAIRVTFPEPIRNVNDVPEFLLHLAAG
jgi:putative heme iron utilization protein